jgi:hypothetical protein
LASIKEFNCIPNIRYWVSFINNGSNFDVYLYKSLSDSQSAINNVANATSQTFGATVEIILTSGENFTISKFDDTKDYHLKVDYQVSDSDTTFQVGPFHDKEVQDDLLTTYDMILERCTYELYKGSHVSSFKTIDLNHLPSRQDGQIIRLNTEDFSNIDHEVESITIRWDGKKLYDNVKMKTYEDIEFFEED